ncbi:MAG: FHA domain-containing protein [Bacillota bacterium]|jgi:molybdopterin converting factor small subunit|nr:FHA domain-containing protein [Bacillota bacterium]
MGKKVKKCPRCGFVNDEYAIFCANPECRESLMYVTAVSIEPLPKEEPGGDPPVDPPTPHTAQLECLSQPGFTFEVKDQGIIGRQGDIDVSCLENCDYISRLHARFIYAGGKWYLQNLSDTNKTMVNNFRVPKGSQQVLSDGDRITLANTSFLFKVMKP